MNKLQVRVAVAEDAAALLKIYAPYVEKTAITFEYTVPELGEFTKKITDILHKYPVLVAESEEGIIGYAYANSFYSRAAYDWAVETSIYVAENCKQRGIGRLLYAELERILKCQNIVNMYACIACPIEEDEYLTWDSVKFHERQGFRVVGEFRQCGYKFGRWYNMVWMEKHIGEHLENQPPVQWLKN